MNRVWGYSICYAILQRGDEGLRLLIFRITILDEVEDGQPCLALYAEFRQTLASFMK